jgi:cytidine deaminase
MILRSELPPLYRSHLEEVERSLLRSHCPHSGLQVAAGLCLENGQLVTGVNYESDSYGLTLCAERTAIARAQANGSIQLVRAVLVSADWKIPGKQALTLSPCGACRQWIAELSERLAINLPVYCFWKDLPEGSLRTASELLPNSFAKNY